MRAGLVKFIAGAAALILAGGAALLPVLVPPRTDGLAVPAGQTAPFDGTLYVSVQGEGVAFPGSYAVPYGTTYGELLLWPVLRANRRIRRKLLCAWGRMPYSDGTAFGGCISSSDGDR